MQFYKLHTAIHVTAVPLPVFSPTLEPDAVVDYFQGVSHSIVLSHLYFLSFCRETNMSDCLWQFTHSQLFN